MMSTMFNNLFGGGPMGHHFPSYQPPAAPFFNQQPNFFNQQQPMFQNNQQQALPAYYNDRPQMPALNDPLMLNYDVADTNYLSWIVHLLKNHFNILMVCFDFDKTLVDIHTGGQWHRSPEELARHVRPCFRFLIPELFKATIHVCVVTYSGQEDLIRETLRIACNLCETRTRRLVIRGNSPDFLSRHSLDEINYNGKEQHIKSAIRILEERWRVNHEPPTANVSRVPIGTSNIFLIDDDEKNRRIARERGHLTFGVPHNIRLVDIYSYLYYEAERQGKLQQHNHF